MTTPTRHSFSLDEWHRMGDVLGGDARVELIEGEIVEMSPIGARHARCVNRLNRLLVVAVGDRAEVSPQNPVELDEHSEPRPDLAVLHPDPAGDTTPRAGDVLLVVEVVDTSLAFDREVKAPLYARAGIPTLWIVDLQAHCVEVLTDPSPTGYRHRRVLVAGDRLVLADLAELPVSDVLGPGTGA